MRGLLLVIPAVVALVAGCSDPIIDVGRSDPSSPPAGFHTVSYHGVSVDVPDEAKLVQAGPCGGGWPETGSFVEPLFFGGAASCPAQRIPSPGETPTPTPRPADELSVVLGPVGERPTGLTDPRHVDDTTAGVTVTAAGPAAEVDAVLASVRDTPLDSNGCGERIDPNVAPRNTASDTLVPSDVAAIVVCEYAQTDGDPGDPTSAPAFWLVASAALDPQRVTAVADVLRSATPVDGGATSASPSGPVLRLLVRGGDDTVRTLQALVDIQPEPVTDGQRTVGADADGFHPPIPTPFDG